MLVKWWLLALPHYFVVSVFVGGAWYAASRNGQAASSGVSLIDLLVLVAGVLLLFTGRYPKGLFDFVVGLDRWVLRVAAYAALMTDEYPPFALDQGGGEEDVRSANVVLDPTGPNQLRLDGDFVLSRPASTLRADALAGGREDQSLRPGRRAESSPGPGRPGSWG